MSEPRLWETYHPYYCSEGCFFHSPAQHGDKWQVHTTVNSWAEFMADWGLSDPDLNLVFRWDWQRSDPDDYAYETEHDPEFELPGDELQVFFYLQRKAYGHSVFVRVTEDDEPAVRKWLTSRAEHMQKVWFPLLGGESS